MTMIEAQHLSEDMLVDLEGDPFVSCDEPGCNLPQIYEFEYGRVDFVELEEVGMKPAVVYLTNGDAYAFPRTHQLNVIERTDT